MRGRMSARPIAQAALAALLACAATGVRAQDAVDPVRLPRLEHFVRTADARALPALRAVEETMMARPYAERIAFLKLLRRAYADVGDIAASVRTADRMASLAQAQGDALNTALGLLARIETAGDHVQPGALAVVNEIDVRYAGLRQPEFTAALQRSYAAAYMELGQFDFAQSHYLKGLEIVRQHPDLLEPTANALRLGLAKVYVYTDAPDKVLAIFAQIDAGGGVLAPTADTRRYVTEGIARVMRGQLDEGRAAYRKGLAIAHAHGLTMYEASALANIADSWLEDGQYVEAERAARAALALAEQAHDGPTHRVSEGNLGFALAGQGHLAEGLVYIDRVLAEQREAGALPDMANVLLEKSRMLEKAGLVRQALEALKAQREVAGKLTAAERANTARVLQEQFNVQRRAIEIESLRRENVLKDAEIRKRRVLQLVAWTGAGLALLLCGFVWRLYRRSMRTSRQLRELNEELAFHSTHDALTGLLNRRSFRTAMAQRQPGTSRCFVLLDIDHFKAINDRLGHAAGDEVLVDVARRLRACVDTRGLVLRWGGEEFLVYVDGGDAAAHAELVRALLGAVAGEPVATGDGQLLPVTITAGALSVPPGLDDALDWQHALALADAALYRGKQAGRRCAYLDVAGRTGTAAQGMRLVPEDAPAASV
jgi:diguanylate cyclase (GGDEF)-like protein